MSPEKLKTFWADLERTHRFKDVIPNHAWSTDGGRKRAYAATYFMSGLKFRYLIRRGNIAAVELQIDTSDGSFNRRALERLRAHTRDIESAFGAQLVWEADWEGKEGRRRACVRYCL